MLCVSYCRRRPGGKTGTQCGRTVLCSCIRLRTGIHFRKFHKLKRHVESVRKSSSITGILVGNKIDLVHERQVTEAEASELADELGCRFYEVSAADWTQSP